MQCELHLLQSSGPITKEIRGEKIGEPEEAGMGEGNGMGW